MARDYADKVTFLGVPGNDSVEAMQEFVDRYGLPFEQAVTEDGSLWGHFGVAYQPAWVFVDDSGGSTVVPEELSTEDLERRLDELIGS